MNSRAKDLPNGKLTVLERLAYGGGNLANALAFTLISSYLVFYYTDLIGLDAGIIGALMLASRIFDGVSDIIMGHIVDHTKSPQGKGRIWILRMCVPYALACILLFAVPKNATRVLQYIFVFVSYNLVNTVLYTAIAVPYNTMGCLETENPYERGLLGIFSMMGSFASSILVNFTVMPLVNAFGGGSTAWTITIAIYAAIGVLVHLFCFFNTKERITEMQSPEQEEKPVGIKEGFLSLIHNKYWVMFIFSICFLWMGVVMNSGSAVYYAQYILNDPNLTGTILNSAQITQVIFLALGSISIKKLGKGKSFLIGMILMVVGPAVMLINMHSFTMVIVGNIIKGIGTGIGSGCMLGMMGDVVDYGEYKTGIRATGLANSAMTFAQKIASGLGGAVMGWVLSGAGYDGSLAVQNSSAQFAIELCYVILPMVFAALAVAAIFRYDVEKRYNEIHQAIDKK